MMKRLLVVLGAGLLSACSLHNAPLPALTPCQYATVARVVACADGPVSERCATRKAEERATCGLSEPVDPVPDPTPDPDPIPDPDPTPDPDPIPDPDPTPDPVPDAPKLIRVDAYALVFVDGTKWDVRATLGTKVILDSTPKFRVAGAVTACNADRATACGCPPGSPTCREDPRGHIWERVSGACPWSYNAPTGENPVSGFSIKVGPFTSACSSTFRVRPRSDFPGPREPGGNVGREVTVTAR